VDDQGFDELMDEARKIARAGHRAAHAGDHERISAFARASGFETRFVGYEATEWETVIRAVEHEDGRLLAKLEESPFYAEGGGQVSDSGVVETESGRGVVADVYRLGDDQAVALEEVEGELGKGQRARALVDRANRFATMCNHTATHLLHASLRDRLGPHVRQAGSYVGPDKLRFDFTHGERLSKQELAEVQDAVNAWIVENHPVRAVHTTRDEAERLGAIALFGEKYGDWVRMVDVDGVSRELCGGTHVGSTAEIGLFHVTQETSSASNVRRIEALTAKGGIEEFRRRTEEMHELAEILRVPERDVVNAVRRMQASLKEATRGPKVSVNYDALLEELLGQAEDVNGLSVLAAEADVPEPKELLVLSDRLRQRLGDGAVLLGAAVGERVQLVANFAPAAVDRGLDASTLIREVAAIVGGGGGGRPTLAQAGGKEPAKLQEAVARAWEELRNA
jgi:alanyl-tRNA synthetase